MPQKKENNPLFSLLFFSACIALMFAGFDSFAASGDTNPTVVLDEFNRICPAGEGLTARFAICIQNTVSWAVNRYLAVYLSYFIATINVVITFAVIMYAIMVFIGKANPSREGVVLAIKIGFIVFLINLGNYALLFPALIDIINWFVTIVTSYATVHLSPHCPNDPFIWNRLDCALNMLIGGILSNWRTIATGLTGFALLMIFSKGVGMLLALFAAGIIVKVVLAVLHALFILLSAYIALALLSLLAPIIIPLILFQATKAYFEKWLKMLIGVMLQPIFLFAYLALFLIALEMAIFSGPYSIYRAITCDYAASPQPMPGDVDNPNFAIGNFLIQSGVIQQREGAESPFAFVVGQNTREFAGTPQGAQAKEGGYAGENAVKDAGKDGVRLFDNNGVTVDIGVDALNLEFLAKRCSGKSVLEYLIQLILSFFAAAAVVYIFSTMIQVIPYLGTLVSGDLFGLPNLSNIIPLGSVAGSDFMSKLGLGRKT